VKPFTDPTDLLLVAFMLGSLAGLLLFAAWEWWKARRASEQLRAEREMRRGFKAAHRWGLLPDDLQ
jgi:hypothetical protein